MAIDWANIKNIDDILKLEDEMLFDVSPNTVGDDVVIINPSLTLEEIEDAKFWQNYMKGIMLVTGMPGQGKDMVTHMLGYKAKHYYGRNVITDNRPRKAFGLSIPFSKEFLVEQLDRAWEVATGQIRNFDPDNPPPFKPHVTSDGRWIASRGEVFLRKSFMILNEFGSKYMYVRDPMNPMQTTLLRMFPIWRHLRCVVLGIGTELKDFSFRCYPKVTCEMRCRRIDPKHLLFRVTMIPYRHVKAAEELEVQGKPITFDLNGEAPRECIQPVVVSYLTVENLDWDRLTETQRVAMDLLMRRQSATLAELRKEAGDSKDFRFEIDVLAKMGFIKLEGLAWKDLFNTDNAQAIEPPKSLRRGQ